MLFLNQTSNLYSDKRNGFVMKCRSQSIGHTFFWVKSKLRYGLASPWDLLRVKGASPDLKLFSPGRRTCELDRPECDLKKLKLRLCAFNKSKLKLHNLGLRTHV